MLNSLVFGSDKLVATENAKKKKVIDQKTGFKLGQLRIGHDIASSCTFSPEIIYSES